MSIKLGTTNIAGLPTGLVDTVNGKADSTTVTALQNASNFNATGKSILSGYALPSSSYTDLTLGASGSSYTAPANGYYYLRKRGNNNQYGNMYNSTRNFGDERSTSLANEVYNALIPCLKDDVVKIYYSLSGTTDTFRFIYAEGEV